MSDQIPAEQLTETIVPSIAQPAMPMEDRTSRSAENLEVNGAGGLEARGVHAWFDKHHALADVNLHFPQNTVTGLIGPSGCGKSTFLRLLNRMHEFIPKSAMAGEVLFNGDDIYGPSVDATEIRTRIGMVFQKPNPFPSMTIGENVIAGLKLDRKSTRLNSSHEWISRMPSSA